MCVYMYVCMYGCIVSYRSTEFLLLVNFSSESNLNRLRIFMATAAQKSPLFFLSLYLSIYLFPYLFFFLPPFPNGK